MVTHNPLEIFLSVLYNTSSKKKAKKFHFYPLHLALATTFDTATTFASVIASADATTITSTFTSSTTFSLPTISTRSTLATLLQVTFDWQ